MKLNLGSADVKLLDYKSVDLYNHNADYQMDVLDLKFDDNSIDEILASHLFEHLSPHYAVPALKEWYRVLKPGARLIMEMPDFEKLCVRFLNEKDYNKRLEILNAIFCPSDIVNGKPVEGSNHLWGWWPESMYYHLSWTGYVNISFYEQTSTHPYDNFSLAAYKPL